MTSRDLRPWGRVLVAAATAVLAAACGSGGSTAANATSTMVSRSVGGRPVSDRAVAASAAEPTGAASAHASTRPSSHRRRLLAGEVIGIDPGHNGGNFEAPSVIGRIIWNGREQETCDTTGTATDGGYTEARFNFRVARYLERDLLALGARVVLTRTSNDGIGPCVDTRARIIDRSHAAVAIDIHADGGPASGRGVAILEPVADGPNDRVIKASERLGAHVLRQYRAITGMPASTYDGTNGVAFRDDLAGLNLTTVPKILIECGNMRNPIDAAELVSPRFQQKAARAFTDAITRFLGRSA